MTGWAWSTVTRWWVMQEQRKILEAMGLGGARTRQEARVRLDCGDPSLEDWAHWRGWQED